MSKSDSDRVIQSESERARESLAHKYVKVKIVAKISFTHREPKNDNLHSKPTPQFIQPCFTSSKILLDFPIVGKSRIFKIRMISADSAEWELVKLS